MAEANEEKPQGGSGLFGALMVLVLAVIVGGAWYARFQVMPAYDAKISDLEIRVTSLETQLYAKNLIVKPQSTTQSTTQPVEKK